MKDIVYLGCFVTALASVACGTVVAQDSSQVWVREIEARQYFAVRVGDVDKAVEWYRGVFGLRNLGGSQADDRSWRIDNLGNERLLVEIVRDDRAQPVPFARGFGKVGFHVPDVEAVADRVARATGERPRVVDFQEHGVRIVQLRDPEGNVIQLFSPLARQR